MFSDDPEAPAKNFCDEFFFQIIIKLNIEEFANKVDIVTFEFENIPFKILEYIENLNQFYPSLLLIKLFKIALQKKSLLEMQLEFHD